MRRFAPVWVAPWLLVACGAESGPQRQNLVLIVVDTLRADHADQAAGRASMPAVERLSADGVRFPHAFCQTPITLPSHASLFSSRPPFESGVKLNLQPIPGELPLFAKGLARLGYRIGRPGRAIWGLHRTCRARQRTAPRRRNPDVTNWGRHVRWRTVWSFRLPRLDRSLGRPVDSGGSDVGPGSR